MKVSSIHFTFLLLLTSSIYAQNMTSNSIGSAEIMKARGEKVETAGIDDVLYEILWAEFFNPSALRPKTAAEKKAQADAIARQIALEKQYLDFMDERLYFPILQQFQQGDTNALYNLFVANRKLNTFAGTVGKNASSEEIRLMEALLEFGRRKKDSYAYYLSGFYTWEDLTTSRAYFEQAEKMGYPRAVQTFDVKFGVGPDDVYYKWRKEEANTHANLDPLIDIIALYPEDKNRIRSGVIPTYYHLAVAIGSYRYNACNRGGTRPFFYGDSYTKAGQGLKKMLAQAKGDAKLVAQRQKLMGDFFMIPEVLKEEVLYISGKHNPKKALALYQESADAGNEAAYLPLGTLYYLGDRGVEKNPQQARRYIEIEAKKDSKLARYYLAKMLEKGIGGPKNLDKAAALYSELAAKKTVGDTLVENSFRALQRIKPELAAQHLPHYFLTNSNYSGIKATVQASPSKVQILVLDDYKALNKASSRFDTTSIARALEISALNKKYQQVQWIMAGNFENFSLGLFEYEGEAYVFQDPKRQYAKLAREFKPWSVQKPEEFVRKGTEKGYPAVFVYQDGEFLRFFGKSEAEGVITDYVEQLLK